MKQAGKAAGMLLLAFLLVFGVLAVPVQAAGKTGLNKTSLSLHVGDSEQLKLNNAPKGKAIKWRSSGKSVATVTKTGLVEAKKAGKAKITASVGGKKYSCAVTVTKGTGATSTEGASGKNKSDVAALEKVIREQASRGATVSADLNEKEQYVWSAQGRIVQVMWYQCGLKGALSLNGLSELVSLDVRENGLTALDVSKNQALQVLDCSGNELESLKLDGCTKINYLSCGNNRLAALDMGGKKKLESLQCRSNALASLNVDGCGRLRTLVCNENQLTSLNVGSCTNLRVLGCGDNQLASLDVSKNAKLTGLGCDSNRLGSLDVSKNVKLESLDCTSNQLISLDVSKNIKLTRLACKGNRLTSLDISNNTKLKDFYCDDSVTVTK